MITAVDTNILLDVLIPNQIQLKPSLQKLEKASKKGRLVICEIVCAELATQFESLSEVNIFLSDTLIEIGWSNKESLFLASRLWMDYLKQSPKKRSCPECGKQIDIRCPQCASDLNLPRRMLNDFIIGSHAKIHSDALLTRDRGFYKKYFSGLALY